MTESVADLSSFTTASSAGKQRLGELLVAAGKLNQADVERVLAYQKKHGLRFGEAAQKLGLLTETDFQQILALQFGYPYLNSSQTGCSTELISAFQPFGAQAEAFRSLRSELLLGWFDGSRKQLAMLGVGESSGCSFICANLAVTFSQLGLRTLLIDANLRQPKQHDFFGLEQCQGLANLLADRLDLPQAIHKIPAIDNLAVLPAGPPPPNPQELVAGVAYKQLLQTLNERYDVILLDTCNGLLYADAKHIVAASGAALLISRNHHSQVNDVRNLQEQIGSAHAQLLGVVLNEF